MVARFNRVSDGFILKLRPQDRIWYAFTMWMIMVYVLQRRVLCPPSAASQRTINQPGNRET